MVKIVPIAVALVAGTASALAADLPARVAAPPPSPIIGISAFSWTGFYIGGSIGGAWGKSNSRNEPGLGAGNGFDNGPVAIGVSNSPSGLASSVQVGYNYQFGAAVLGVEGELGGLGLRQSTFIVPAPDNAASVQYRGFGSLTVRAGYAIDRTLLYAKAGIGAAQIRNGAADLINGTAIIDASDLTRRSGVRTGWVLGAGVEHAFWNNLTVRLDYQYMDFGSSRSTNIDGDVFRHRNSLHLVRLGLNYLFSSTALPVVAKY